MDSAWKERSQEWGIFNDQHSMTEISYAHLPYQGARQTGPENAVMKRIQIPAEDDGRVAEVEKEINNIKLLNGKDAVKYATSAKNKLKNSKGGLTVYIALRAWEDKNQRELYGLGNGNRALTSESTDQVRTEYKTKHPIV
jgi:hypothetical protein